MKTYGKRVWLIPDAYFSSVSTKQKSHEAVCVINTSDCNARIKFTLMFEDRDPIEGFESFCLAKHTHHIRMDKLEGKNGITVPMDVPYAILVESSVEIVVQYSRLDTSQAEMALMTTMAYSVE